MDYVVNIYYTFGSNHQSDLLPKANARPNESTPNHVMVRHGTPRIAALGFHLFAFQKWAAQEREQQVSDGHDDGLQGRFVAGIRRVPRPLDVRCARASAEPPHKALAPVTVHQRADPSCWPSRRETTDFPRVQRPKTFVLRYIVFVVACVSEHLNESFNENASCVQVLGHLGRRRVSSVSWQRTYILCPTRERRR